MFQNSSPTLYFIQTFLIYAKVSVTEEEDGVEEEGRRGCQKVLQALQPCW